MTKAPLIIAAVAALGFAAAPSFANSLSAQDQASALSAAADTGTVMQDSDDDNKSDSTSQPAEPKEEQK